MYNWHTNIFPATPFDTQIHIDINEDIYKYDSATTTWKRYFGAVLRHVKTYQYLAGRTGSPFTMPAQDNEGNVMFQYSFVIVEYYDAGSLAGTYYFALPTQAELGAHYVAFYPNKQVIYQIYDVFDSRLNINRITGHNSLYGSLRGRKSYYRTTEHSNFGIAGGFHSVTFWAPTFDNFGDYLMQFFWGIDSSLAVNQVENELVIWQSHSRYTLYHQPKIGFFILSGFNSKRAYKESDNEFVVINGMNMNIGEPMFFYFNEGSTLRTLTSMKDMSGSGIFYNKANGILIYPLRSNDGDYYSFLVKPLGIDTISIRCIFMTPDIRTMSETVYKNARMVKNSLLPMHFMNDPFAGHYRVWQSFYMGSVGKYNAGLDKDLIPDYVKYYRRNLVNGVRSEYHDGVLKIHKRKNNAPLFMTITRKRG